VTTVALLLVVGGSFIHAFWNLLAKKGPNGPLFVWAYSGASAVVYLPLAIWAVATSDIHWGPWEVGAVVLSGALHLGYALSLQGGYQRSDLSVVYPVARGTGPVISVAGAVLLLGEPFSGAIALGTALVVGGVFLVGFTGRHPDRPFWPGVLWGGMTGLFIAAYTLNDGAAVKVLGLAPIIIDYFGNLVRLAMLTPMAVRRRALLPVQLQGHGKIVLAIGVLMPIPYIASLYAMKLAPLSLIAPARELSMMTGVVLGRWLLGEPSVVARFAGAALIVAGVVVLSLG
jgi:drug/metabolite transporter (DMT)-like permease